MKNSILAVLFWLAPAAALAQAFSVTNSNDAGAGSLRQALINANASGTSDTISFDAGIANR